MSESDPVTRDQATALFDQFCEAFATFDAECVGRLFATPGVAFRNDGTLVSLATREDLHRYYQAVLDHFQSNGARTVRWSDLAVLKMGTRAVLATVTWELLDADGAPLMRWRQSYNLAMLDGAPKIFASAMHAT
jgi:hypothetical protein